MFLSERSVQRAQLFQVGYLLFVGQELNLNIAHGEDIFRTVKDTNHKNCSQKSVTFRSVPQSRSMYDLVTLPHQIKAAVAVKPRIKDKNNQPI